MNHESNPHEYCDALWFRALDLSLCRIDELQKIPRWKNGGNDLKQKVACRSRGFEACVSESAYEISLALVDNSHVTRTTPSLSSHPTHNARESYESECGNSFYRLAAWAPRLFMRKLSLIARTLISPHGLAGLLQQHC